MNHRRWICIGALLGFFAVLFGAFGAHGLAHFLSPQSMAIFQTGIQYHITHALALILFGIHGKHHPEIPTWPGTMFVVGILCFSGSLYVLAITDIQILRAITPIGGTAFLAGWIGFALVSGKRPGG